MLHGSGVAGSDRPCNQIHPNNAFSRFPAGEVEQSIPSRFEQMAVKYPDRLAAKDRNQELTYLELNRAADSVACAILKHSESGEEPVAILIDQGIQAIVAILGVLKAGRPYVFLDPALSSDRNDFILSDSNARLLLHDGNNVTDFHPGLDAIRLEECRDAFPGSMERPSVSPDSPACLVYTSGSTGVPKGVIQNHRSLLAVTANYTNCFHLAPEDRLCFLQSPSVIAAVRMIWLALCNGAALCLYDLKREGSVRLAHWLREERITLLTSVPSVFRHFTGMLTGQERFPDLRLIRLGGEHALFRDVESYQKHFSEHCLLVNRIGSTEIGTYSWYCMNKETVIDQGAVPVGYPMEGFEVLLLDENGEEIRGSETGEIAVRSRFLASGYWNRPDLTKAAFSLAQDGTGERMYRTGDLGRRLPDGCLIHMGRNDHQVKVRGFRVEVAEIENALLNLDYVRESVVMPWKGKDGENHLVAYLGLVAGATLSRSAVRRAVAQKLPDYMVPACFVQVDTFPRAPSGKIDRGSLPPPDSQRPFLDTPFAAPRSTTEEIMAALWIEVLGLDEVGIHDRFLDLGGDSLRAMQLISRIRDVFQLELSIQTLLESPDIEGLVSTLKAVQTGQGGIVRQGLLGQTIPVRNTSGPGPLSFSQERMWFLSQLDNIGAAYHVPHACRLTGTLNRNALENALQAIVKRHQVLRTTYGNIDGIPMQIVRDALTITLKVINAGSDRRDLDDEEILNILGAEIQQPFDLSRDLMIRASLLCLANDEHVLLIVIHHIASDGRGWTLQNLMRELSTCYNACVGGYSPDLPELAIQYADFAEWQRRSCQGEKLDQQLAYWKGQLDGCPALLPLPTDRPRPPRQAHRGAVESVEFSSELTAALRGLSRSHRVTLFMTLLAGFKTLLFRYCGSDDIVVASPNSGRTRMETEELIGFFGNTLVLRSDLSGNPSFRQLLQRVRKVAMDAYANQDLPFEKLVAELNPVRSPDRSPLFQVMFVLQSPDAQLPSLTGIQARMMHPGTETSKFDLTLSLQEGHETIEGAMEYDTDLFEAATIKRLLGHYHNVLRSVVKEPDQSISSLPLLSDRERQQLLIEWNDTANGYRSDACVHELFEAQLERTPHVIAVNCEKEQITYRELDRRANRLAHQLQQLGVGPNLPVGICLDRSIEQVMSVLAILKAGGAYVPLDPAYPKERLAFMLKDSGTSLLVTSKAHVENLPTHGVRLVCLDGDVELPAVESGNFTPNTATAGDLAYIMYTSGSTGKPKGVAMPHAPLVNLITWEKAHSVCAEGARTLQRAPLGFDMSFQEIFCTWCSGGTLVLTGDDQNRDPVETLRVINDQKVERLFLPFVALQQLAEAAESINHLPRSVRRILPSGEQLRITPAIARLFERLPHCKLINQYGPTETHVVCAHEMTGAPANWPQLPPIGRPISNTRLYILDKNLEPVPVGVAGELYIGGICLARGYMGSPEMTDAKFIADPFSAHSGARLYKSGDRARYLPDSSIEFLGRLDQQVKIRGFRVEPGEVEAALYEYPSVRETAVFAREIAPGNTKLVAYFVAGEERQVPAAGELRDCLGDCLRDFLRDRLPDYMIPTAFVQMAALPLDANGKVNLQALPLPDISQAESAHDSVAPGTEVEIGLANIWMEVLTCDKIAIHDNFFELGGDSLMATRVITRIHARMDLELPLLTIFVSPTIAEMAQVIESMLNP